MKKKLLKVIKTVCFVLVLFFLVKVIYDNFNDLRHTDFKLNMTVFLISLIIYMVYKFHNAVLWHYLTVKLNCNIRMDNSVIAWSYSQLGKFVPGKVFYLLGRLYYYKKENVSVKKITLCFLLENGYTFLAALFMFIASSTFIELGVLNRYKVYSSLLLFLFFIFINPFFLEKGINLILKILKKEPIKIGLAYIDMVILLIHFVSNWLIMGVGFFVLSASLYPIGLDKFFYLTAVFALSNVIGILSFFAPAGIGIRETILIFALKALMPAPFAVIIAIVSRLWYTAGELLIVLIAFIYEVRFRHNTGLKNGWSKEIFNKIRYYNSHL